MTLRPIITSLLVLSLPPLPAVGQEPSASPPVLPRVASLIKHRGFLALSLSQLALESGFVENPRRFYGAGSGRPQGRTP